MIIAAFKDWTPEQWTVFFGAVAVLLGSVTASIIAIIKAGRGQTDAAEAKATAAATNVRVDDVKEDARVLTSKVIEVAKDTPTTPPPNL